MSERVRHVVRCAAVMMPALPKIASADGGISSIGAMLPVFIVIWTVCAAQVVWLVLTLVVLCSDPSPTEPWSVKLYRILSWAIVAAAIVLALAGSAFLGFMAILAAFASAALIGGVAALVLSRDARRRQSAT